MTPNIDERGKRQRLRGGIALLAVAALIVFAWALPQNGAAAWALGVSLGLVGAFMIFEARNGWCALRALGFKTRC